MSIRAIKWAHALLPLLTLPPTERCVLLVLAYRHHDRTGACFPGMKTIAEDCGVGERRARQAVNVLKTWGVIKVRRGSTAAGNASNRYTLFGKPKRPKENGNPLPVSEVGKPAQKSRFQRGNRVPVSNRQTVADDRGYSSEMENPGQRLRLVQGGRANG
ncbi:helix-turn-helix domain-containing protein [Rhodobaculum claviforme]|uniref:Helix-turn-helix domain-containing protein n=1 Tax=Rhodobaculum claviforme TaxID=1549854 RepID=A0A934TKG2_9RHOB|nr:helix-turn-helix domain-containing protein [Rhodobaculum claviforme]MBK5927086.1 hypothetical protein [Rhodobaculum claviforme]